MIVSIHVPKSAGTSFKRVLSDLCPNRVWFNYGAIFSKADALPGIVPQDTGIIHGHFLGDAFDDLIPDRILITWVRDPVERLVSNYYHFLRTPDMRDNCCRMLHEHKLSLREFAELEWMRDETTRYLAYKPLDEFEFVGIAERFDESLTLFCERFGFRRPRVSPMENINPARHAPCYELSGEDRRFILDLNAMDEGWYRQALSRHRAEMRTARRLTA